MARFGRIPLEAHFPLSDAARTREAVLLSGDAERDARYPHLAALRRANGGGAMAAVPLLAGDRLLGTLGFDFPEERPLGPAERDYLQALAQQCAQAMDRARLDAAERAARAEAERAAQVTSRITAHLADGVVMMDAEGRLTYMNPAAERIVGWTQAELLGDLLHERLHYLRPDGSPYPMAECPLRAVLDAGRPVLDLPDQWVRKDGTFVHVVTTCSPILADGRVVGAVLSLHDDTHRRRAESERERLLAEAESANRAKSDFLAVMSHELRTPLNAILGYADLLDAGVAGPLADPQRAFVTRGRDAARRLLTLVEDVLSFAKLEAGRVAIQAAPVPVRALVGSAAEVVAPQAAQRGLSLTVDAPPPALLVRADGERAGQVLLNLLSNALKFTPPGGRVALRVAPDEAWVRVHVEDTGVGVAPEQHERIFEPFVQVGGGLTRASEGTGLGLAISRELARAMGGDVTVESAPGAGSTFTLVLPRV
jgi:PAS domain S-box-containing protein